MASEAEWAWVAGIFEGAGTIVTVNAGRDLRLSLHLTDADVATRYAEVVGSRVLGPYAAPPTDLGTPRRSTYRCNLNGRRALAALAEMSPWLSEQKKLRLGELGFGAGI